jgi:dimethylamine/trimethylamine dehydrogenase
VIRESALPGLSEWRRVVDWRLTQIQKMKHVGVYPSSPMTAEEILETGAQHIILSTGATWRRDGMGRTLRKPVRGYDLQNVFSPDDLMDGENVISNLVIGNWMIYDDDHYYMGGVLAEMLAEQGCQVSLVTPAPLVSYWSQFTLEQERIQQKLMRLGVRLYPQHILSGIEDDCVSLINTISGEGTELSRDGVVLVSDRISNDSIYYELKPALEEGKLSSLRVIGDAEAPNIIAQAVFSGHLAAREFEDESVEGTPFKMERITF